MNQENRTDRTDPKKLMWDEFTQTGKIGAYMLYRALVDKKD